jgi:YesN/AraC family two-component response regulator
MKIYIKNMVCIRCKMIVTQELKKLSIQNAIVKLGEVDLSDNISIAQLDVLRAGLLRFGLVILDDKKTALVEKIKKVIIELVHYKEQPLNINFSAYLSKALNYEYTFLANLFSEVEGINVEHYLITHKIERVKELLIYDKLTLTDISYKMNYSSVAQLCNQFKKVTGLTPSYYKKSR